MKPEKKLQLLSYLPNTITIGRIIALVPLVWLLLNHHYAYALLVALLAGASDGLDGFLARRFGWQGWLGGILDPLADKAMMTCCYAVLAWQGILPMWLFLLVILRDIVIIGGTSYYHFKIGKIKQAKPTLLSKANTALQILLLLLVLLNESALWQQIWLIEKTIYLVAITTFFSGVQYVFMGCKMARQTRMEEQDVD